MCFLKQRCLFVCYCYLYVAHIKLDRCYVIIYIVNF